MKLENNHVKHEAYKLVLRTGLEKSDFKDWSSSSTFPSTGLGRRIFEDTGPTKELYILRTWTG